LIASECVMFILLVPFTTNVTKLLIMLGTAV